MGGSVSLRLSDWRVQVQSHFKYSVYPESGIQWESIYGCCYYCHYHQTWTWDPYPFQWSCSVWLISPWNGIYEVNPKWKVEVKVLVTQFFSDSLWLSGLWPTRLLYPRNFPGKNTWLGTHSLLQSIFVTKGLSPGLPCCRQILYCLGHQGSSKLAQMPQLLPTCVECTESNCYHYW